jgi:hypothetical protein
MKRQALNFTACGALSLARKRSIDDRCPRARANMSHDDVGHEKCLDKPIGASTLYDVPTLERDRGQVRTRSSMIVCGATIAGSQP